MANKKKKEPLVLFTLRLPRSIIDRLEKRAQRESAKSGTVNVSATARTLLQEHA